MYEEPPGCRPGPRNNNNDASSNTEDSLELALLTTKRSGATTGECSKALPRRSHSNWTGRTRMDAAAAPGREASRRKVLTRTSARVAAAVLGLAAARREGAGGVDAIVTVIAARVWWFFVSWWGVIALSVGSAAATGA